MAAVALVALCSLVAGATGQLSVSGTSPRNGTVINAMWNRPLTVPGPVGGPAPALTITGLNGAPHFSMWPASGGSLPLGLVIDPTTAAIAGTPYTSCTPGVASCQSLFDIQIFLANSTTSSSPIFVESFSLNITFPVVAPSDSGGVGDSDSSPSTTVIWVSALACFLALVVIVAGAVLWRRSRSGRDGRNGGVEAAKGASVAAPAMTTTTNPAAETPSTPAGDRARPVPKPRTGQRRPRAQRESVVDDMGAAAGHVYIEVETFRPSAPGSPTAAAAVTGSGGAEVAALADDTDEGQPWFAGDMRRTACERAVAAAQHGDFLIRRSRNKSSAEGALPSFVLVVNSNGTATNFPIDAQADPATGAIRVVFAGAPFASLRALVRVLRLNPISGADGQAFTLALPAPFDDSDESIFTASFGSARSSSMSQAPEWYAGVSSRGQVENMVSSAGHGDFLVRQSRTSRNYVLVVNDGGSPVSFQIERLDDGYRFGETSFADIDDLIAFLRASPLQSPTGGVLHLGRPAGRAQLANISQV